MHTSTSAVAAARTMPLKRCPRNSPPLPKSIRFFQACVRARRKQRHCIEIQVGHASELCRMNHKRDGAAAPFASSATQTHISRPRADTGVDCIGDFPFSRPLCAFLDALDSTNQLTKTILFNIYPADNEMLVSIAGAFRTFGGGKSTRARVVVFRPERLHDPARRRFIGVGTFRPVRGHDHGFPSFLSFSRHEYFRRILCGVLGRDMENGDIPGDFDLIGGSCATSALPTRKITSYKEPR